MMNALSQNISIGGEMFFWWGGGREASGWGGSLVALGVPSHIMWYGVFEDVTEGVG
jgi:hypothetical protein